MRRRLFIEHGPDGLVPRGSRDVPRSPGTGKSAVARLVAARTGAVWLRIGSIEQAIRDCWVRPAEVADAGYRAAGAGVDLVPDTASMPAEAAERVVEVIALVARR